MARAARPAPPAAKPAVKAAASRAARKAVWFLNGPNANLYGLTAQGTYGADTYDTLKRRCEAEAQRLSLALSFRQSNAEGELIDWVQEAMGKADGLIVNGAGLTYTSIALLDALLAFQGPIVEVHMSNIYRREAFRHHSYISRAATGIVAGLGADGYELAIAAMRRLLDRPGSRS
ncbi:MAG: 3-dehydroquinate dehydratase [Betaproteobacteria bacterium]|jgi:3-dehydroquinate dehydratase-2|nr:3-dehydroquinate dehydratase [Betaproteobacteria bacterium]